MLDPRPAGGGKTVHPGGRDRETRIIQGDRRGRAGAGGKGGRLPASLKGEAEGVPKLSVAGGAPAPAGAAHANPP